MFFVKMEYSEKFSRSLGEDLRELVELANKNKMNIRTEYKGQVIEIYAFSTIENVIDEYLELKKMTELKS